MLNTCFESWRSSGDEILRDFAARFLDRKPLKSMLYDAGNSSISLDKLRETVNDCGFDKRYYTGTNNSFDLPYKYDNANIKLIEKNGNLIELSQASSLVAALADKSLGDERFFFPKEMLEETTPTLFHESQQKFLNHIRNDRII